MVEDLVCCELLSAFKFPDHQGKCREISLIHSDFVAEAIEKPKYFMGFFSKFPSNRNREFLLQSRETDRWNRETGGAIKEFS